ncbi:MAG TPA: ATP-binding protein [Kofleriaceae bacterium]|nr:ATP-binding protein [Kofleriaceae bacterium]
MPAETTNKIEILLVDDRREDLTALTSVLEGLGYEMITAQSGADGLRRALEHDFAVIVLDVVMPGIDGFEVASLLRRRPRTAHTPIIFLTGAGTDPGSIYRAYSVGAVDYLMKPVDADVLRAKVATFVDLFRMDQRIRQQAEALLATERRMRELEVAEIKLVNERRYRNLADAIPQIVWTADPQGVVTYFNQRWTTYTGTSLAEPNGPKSWLDAVHPDERALCRLRWAEALARGTHFEVECRLRAQDGSYRWHLCRSIPERNRGGEIVGWLGTHTDFDDLVRAREETEAARVRSEMLAEASQILASTLELPNALEKLSGVITQRLADVCVIDAIDPGEEDTPLREPLIVAHRDPGKAQALEESWRARDGVRAGSNGNGDGETTAERLARAGAEPRVLRDGKAQLFRELDDEALWMLSDDARHREVLRGLGMRSAIVVPICNGAKTLGAITLFSARGRNYDMADLGLVEDLGRRAGTALENAVLYAQTERAVLARDEFLSVASHELRTPLSALMLQLGGLERTINGGDERVAKKTAAALRHTHRLAKLVESLLDVSRLATGRLTLNVEDCDLGDLVREVADRLAEEAKQAGCSFELAVDGSVRGPWDRLRVEQVVTNLLANALKYGAGHPIEIDVSADPDTAILTVRDHGIGIATDDLPRIFDRFERAAPAHHYGGLGLGLYIAREIVHAHGGWIRAASWPEQGATFTVELPRAAVVASTSQRLDNTPPPARARASTTENLS